jgi:phospho-N-acetylmuramoyl-pentapeptide-transferase
MLHYIFDFLDKAYNIPGAGLFQYITFRAGAAIILSLIITMIFGGRIIRSLKNLQVGETVSDLGLDGQKGEGGHTDDGWDHDYHCRFLIPCILFAKLNNIYIILMIFTTVWMGIIGFADDYIKVFKKNKDGLSGKTKIFGQVILRTWSWALP